MARWDFFIYACFTRSLPARLPSEPELNDAILKSQSRSWNRHAAQYEEIFLDPYHPRVDNPLWNAIDCVVQSGAKVVADLGCGTGPLLPYLNARFERVFAIDFAPAMLERARSRLDKKGLARTTFLERPMHALDDLAGQVDLALAVNSLVMPEILIIDRTIANVKRCLKPGGSFIGVVPSIDAISYHLMLLVDQGVESGFSEREAERLASLQIERRNYDFAMGRFRTRGLRQKFWQSFEVELRMRKAGFLTCEIGKVLYPWDEAESGPGGQSLAGHPRSWDWFFHARV